MSEDLDEIAQELLRQLWSGYGLAAIDHAQNPRNVGSIADADGFGSVDGSCGDNMEIWLKVEVGVIRQATFWTEGCGSTVACGSMVTELARGKSVEEAGRLSERQILEALGWLPEDSHHCAMLAASTLSAAVQDYLARQQAV